MNFGTWVTGMWIGSEIQQSVERRQRPTFQEAERIILDEILAEETIRQETWRERKRETSNALLFKDRLNSLSEEDEAAVAALQSKIAAKRRQEAEIDRELQRRKVEKRNRKAFKKTMRRY